jgi:hypothetical protein
MPVTRRTNPYANPFFGVLIAASILFTVTALGYLMGPSIIERARSSGAGERSARSLAAAEWLDKRGPTALGVEFTLMLASGVLAMATDSWFSRHKSAAHGSSQR